MYAIQRERTRARDSRLRFVFSDVHSDTVVSVGLSANATFEDVARTLSRFPKRRYGTPVAIHVTVAPESRAATYVH